MRRWLAGLFLFMPMFAAAQLSYVYDLKQRGANVALLLPTGKKIEQPFGLKFDIELVAIGGARQENGALFGGFGGTVPVPLAKNVGADIGLFVRFEQNKPVGGGFILSIRFK